MFNNEVNALISLIEDPDEAIYFQVRSELKNYGPEIIPQLEQYWELHTYGALFHRRLEELIASIQYDSVYNRLRSWRDSPEPDLLEGTLILNRYQHPSADEDEIRRSVMRVRQDIWLELNDNLTAFETVKVFNHIFYKLHGFHGGIDQFDDAGVAFLSDLFQSRSGNPLSIGILYALLARSLELPIYGVNLPSHFVLCYLDHGPDHSELGLDAMDADVLFYINPYSEGSILHHEEIDIFLKKQQLPPDERFYRPCSNLEMICRMINSLIHFYISRYDEEKVRELRSLQSVLLELEN